MKQKKINEAYPALVRLSHLTLPPSKAYGIYKMGASINKQYEFAAGEQRKYLDEYGGKPTEDGSIQFKTPKKCSQFKGKIEELNDLDVDVTIEPIELTEADIGTQKISPADIASLEGFISFNL